MDNTDRILQLAGTFLPFYGIALTILSAITLHKTKRLAALIIIPLLTLWLCSALGEFIAYDGNMLYVTLALI